MCGDFVFVTRTRIITMSLILCASGGMSCFCISCVCGGISFCFSFLLLLIVDYRLVFLIGTMYCLSCFGAVYCVSFLFTASSYAIGFAMCLPRSLCLFQSLPLDGVTEFPVNYAQNRIDRHICYVLEFCRSRIRCRVCGFRFWFFSR